MLDFILYNPIFERLLIFLFFINILTTFLIDYKQTINTNKKVKYNNTIIYKIQLTIILIVLAIMTLFIIIVFSQYLLPLSLVLILFISLIKSIVNIYKNDNTFTLDSKYYYTLAAIVFIMFFASGTVPIYINALHNETQFTKELMLLLFINLKLVLFVFLLLINVFVFISNITDLLPQKQKNFFKNFFLLKSKSYRVIHYNFLLYKKTVSRNYLVIDSIIYTILAPITILLNVFLLILLKLISILRSVIKNIIYLFIEYKKRRTYVIKKITYISIIMSLFLSYIIVVINNDLFMDITKDIFTHFSTVILIPLIYDSIKTIK